MWISKKKWEALEKRVAHIEEQLQLGPEKIDIAKLNQLLRGLEPNIKEHMKTGCEEQQAPEFSDLKHSVHVFDVFGNRLVDIDRDGVKIYDETIKISVCKETGQSDGWAEVKLIYASTGLAELVKSKIEP